MAITNVQSASGFAAGGVQTMAATLSTAATSGNLLIWAIGVDKNAGTVTQPSGFTLPIDIKSTDSSVSLAIAYKVAAGGETAISGSISGANTAGSQIRVYEWADSNSGTWSVLGSATNISTGSNVTTISSGTTSAIAQAGRAFACFASDSVITQGTVTYSNSYAAVASTADGAGGNAGFWAADKDVTSSTAAETTITRTGGSADQMNGAIIVFAKVSGSTQNLTCTGLSSTEAFGTAVVTQAIAPSGLASTETFGTTLLNQFVLPTGPATAEAFGTPALVYFIAGTGIATAEAFGTHAVAISGFSFFPDSIISAEAFGLAVLTTGVHHTWIGGLEVEAIYLGGLHARVYQGGVLTFS